MKRFLILLFASGLLTTVSFAQSRLVGPDFDPHATAKVDQPKNIPQFTVKFRSGFDMRTGKFLGSPEDYKTFTDLSRGNSQKPMSVAWQPIGSSISGLVSGRCKKLAIDPQGKKIAYLATSSGGIWKTTDITAPNVQWINLGDNLPTLAIGAVAVDPTNPNIIYAGTGPNPPSQHDPLGIGIFKSTDGGLNWQHLANDGIMGRTCAAIAIDPKNPNRIYVAPGYQELNKVGVVRSTDAGASWERLDVGDTALMGTSVVVDPIDPMRIYVGGFTGGIFRSTDGGDSWTRSSTGLPTSYGRTELAIAPSSPNVLYAGIAKAVVRAPSQGIYKSDDYGETWRRVNTCSSADRDNIRANYLNQQGDLMNSIAVHPTNAAHLIVGGLDIHGSVDSGKSLDHISEWAIGPTSSDFVHGDIQSLQFSGDTIYACTDGGLATSYDLGDTWVKSMNEGISSLQLVGADSDPSMTFIVSGSQDNGSKRIDLGQTFWEQTRIGDGGKVWVSAIDPNLVYSTHIFADLRKSTDGGKSWLTSNGSGYGNFVTNEDFLAEGTFTFYPPFDVSQDGQVIVMPGFFHMYVSTDGGEDGFAQTSLSDIGLILDVSVSQFDPNFMYACGLGFTYHSSDMGLHWDTVSINNADAGIHVIHADPFHEHEVYTIYYGYGTELHKSTNDGKTWSKFSSLPENLAPNDMVITPDGVIFVGTSQGVIYTTDHGVSWQALRDGLPTVAVTQLSLKGVNNDKLLAATYGRGAYWIDISGLKSSVTPSVAEPSVRFDPIHPNPAAQEANLQFSLDKPGEVRIAISDVLGREVQLLEKNFYQSGQHDLRISLANLEEGSYYVSLVANGHRLTQKVTVTGAR